MKHVLLASAVLCSSVPAALALVPRPAEDKLLVDGDWLEAVPWRSIGPANMGGRITDIAVSRDDPSLYWIATASGGLLKTTNGGRTYEHQFDREAVVSIGQVDVAPSNAEIVWVGTGESNPRNSVSYGGGVYKSTDGGKTWKCMGLEETFQIGGLAIHPENPDIVYVGALGRLYGPNEERGLYKTTDGGESWEKLLYVDDKTGVIDVDLDPTAPDTLIVATYERERDGFDTNDPAKKIGPGSGLHKSADGGKTWKKLTEGLPTVTFGRVGVDYWAKDPSHVYAVIETERTAQLPDDAGWAGLAGEDADVGARLTNITEEGPAAAAGLKEGDIVLRLGERKVLGWESLVRAIREHKDGDTVEVEYVRDREDHTAQLTFAAFPEDERGRSPFSSGLGGQRENLQDEQGREGLETGGLFKSTDGGETWTRVNSVTPRPMYYSEVRVDPSDENHVYVLGTSLYRSNDGGATFTDDGGSDGIHVDHHALWIDPRDGRHMILGNDGGIYVTRDRMEHWDHHNHVAIGQFYHATVDNQPLYKVYGGLQDNGSWGAPNRTRGFRGVTNSDWFRIGGGDGFVCRVDPEDPDLVYYESQNGGMGRWNMRTGERGFLRPRGGQGVRLRFNWETPFQLSHHYPRVFYTAGNHVFRSNNKGDDLEAISPEITLSDEGSASALAESPRDAKVLYVGTDDGALWRTKDGGATWTDCFDPWADEREAEAAERRVEALQALLASVDANADGQIAKDEVPEGLAEFFAKADLDESGALDAEELRALSGEEPPKEEEEAAQPAEQPAAADDPVSGTWNARLTGEGVPAESNRFTLTLELKPDGSVTGSFKTDTKEGSITQGSYDRAKKELSLTYEMEVGVVNQKGTIDGAKMSGWLEAGGGLIKVAYTAERAGAAPPPAAGEAPAAAPATADPLVGTWKARVLGDEVPAETASFTITLKRGEGDALTGLVTSQLGDADVREARFEAETGKLAFQAVAEEMTLAFEAKVEGETMKGSFSAQAFAMEFEAQRESAPAAPEAPAEASPAAEVQEETAEEPAERPSRRERAERPERKKEHPVDETLAELLPKRMWVTSLEASRHDTGRVYVAFDGHRSDDDRPWVFVSEDHGETWKELSKKLPRGSSRVLREDKDNENVLYLGTEFGAWISFDRGTSWQRMQGDLPTVAVHEFSQHPLSGDVLVATHGRSLWVFDATLLRQVTDEATEADAHLFRPDKLIRWGGEPGRGDHGPRMYYGENPRDGVQLYFSLGKKPDAISLRIEGLGGKVLRELELAEDIKRGLHRVTWDGREETEAPQGRRFRRRGRPVAAGTYLAVLEVDGRRYTQEVVLEDDPDAPMSTFFFEEELEGGADDEEQGDGPADGSGGLR